jgi:oxygen-independent coproporphyrinogen-3 oxidase
MNNLYIHVPFCESKCAYCAFYSCVAKPDWDAYAAAVIRDLPDAPMGTCFFGGGTPSLMPPEILQKILTAVNLAEVPRSNHPQKSAIFAGPDRRGMTAEITMECNPGSLTPEKIRRYAAAGINRFSVGVQSFDDNALKFLGRRHSAADARQTIADIKKYAPGARISADFIFPLHGRTAADAHRLCDEIDALNIGHVSIYELSIEPGTPLAGTLPVPDDTAAEIFEILGRRLPRYEVSNYGREHCRHNENIWDGAEYFGVGPAAAGRIKINGVWHEQYTPPDMDAWLRAPTTTLKPMSERDRAIEKVITGLRTARGVALTDDVRDVIDLKKIKENSDLLLIQTSEPKPAPSSPQTSDLFELISWAMPPRPGGEFRLVATDSGLLILDSLIMKIIK